MTASEKKQLMANACKVRMGVIESTYGAKSGHPGGSLSASDLFTYLYFREMKRSRSSHLGSAGSTFISRKYR